MSDASGEQWRLEFELRGAAATARDTVIESMPPQFIEARTHIERIFGGKSAVGDAVPHSGEVRQLWRSLEQRSDRASSGVCQSCANCGARYTPGQEGGVDRQITSVCGFSLRDTRCVLVSVIRSMTGVPSRPPPLFTQGVMFHKEKPVWIEFWVMWRRIAGGLSHDAPVEIWNYLKPHLERRLTRQEAKNQPKLKGVQPEGLDEMVRLAVSLEHLDSEEKTHLGEWIAARVPQAGPGRGRSAGSVPASHSMEVSIEQSTRRKLPSGWIFC